MREKIKNAAVLPMTGIVYAANVTRDTQSFDQFPRLMEAMLAAIHCAYGALGVAREPLARRAVPPGKLV